MGDRLLPFREILAVDAVGTVFVHGIGATELLAAAFDGQDFISNPRVDISLAVNVTVVLVVAGCVAGLFPALKALKIKPVEALRDE